MPERLETPYESGSRTFVCFKAKAFDGDQDENSPSFPIGEATTVAVFHSTDNTAEDVVDIPMKLQISSDGTTWQDAGGSFTNPFDTITLNPSGDETVWQILGSPPTYALLGRIRLESGATTIGTTVTVHVVVGRKTA